jgi:hypothetical protein
MDPTISGFIIAGIAGIGGAALVAGRGIGPVRDYGARVAGGTASAGGSTGYPGGDQELPKVPWWLCGICPIVFSAVLAVIFWAVAREPTPQPAITIVDPAVPGWVTGSAAAGVMRGIAPRGF